MNTTIKYFMFLGSLYVGISLNADANKNPFQEALDNDSSNEKIVDKLDIQNFNNEQRNIDSKKQHPQIFPWFQKKSSALQKNLAAAIDRGDYAELKNYQKGILEKEFKKEYTIEENKEFFIEDNIENDQLLDCWALLIKNQNGPKKLKSLNEFVNYCKNNKIPFEFYFNEEDAHYIKYFSLWMFNDKNLDLKNMLRIGLTINADSSENLYRLLNEKKDRYCNPALSDKAFKAECTRCTEFQKILDEFKNK